MLAPREDLLPLRQLAARLAVALAAYAAMGAYAGLEADPSAAAEGSFLALFSGVLLFAVALLPGPAWELGAGSLLAAAALWSLPPGPARGTAISAILAATLLVAALRRLPEACRDGKLSLQTALALSLGAQVLLRGHLLFAPERNPKTLFALFVLPLAGALAVWWAARRHGVGPAFGAAALTLTLAPGWNVSSLLGWIGLIAGESLVRKETPRWERWTALLLAMGVVARFGVSGAAFVACGAALAAPLPALGVATVLALVFSLPPGPGTFAAALPRLFWCLLLVPSLLLPQRERWAAALAALILAVALPLAPNPGVLAAPVALAVFAASTRPGIALPRQVWTVILFAASALLASYPWLRPTPLPAALNLFGLSPGWMPLLLLVLAVGGLALAASWLGRTGTRREAALRLVGASAALALLAAARQLPRPGTALLTPEVPVVLEAASPEWSGLLPAAAPRRIVLETSLANAAPLPQSTPVATVHLFDQQGREQERVLLAGIDSGEWAAQRPDVRRWAVLVSPAPWVSWIAGGFFAQRYRCRWEVPAGFQPVRIALERSPELPPEVALALHQVEVGP